MAKDTWNKTIKEMDFNERVDWAVGEIIFGIARGESLHNIVWKILNTLANVQ